MGIRKVQYAPDKAGPQPCTVVRKDFVLSPGQLELELTLDKQVCVISIFFVLGGGTTYQIDEMKIFNISFH